MSNIFLSIGEVKGESAVIGHVGEIEALSWSWKLTQPSRVSSYTEARRATIENLSFVHRVSLASNGLMSMLLKSTIAPKAILSLRSPDAQPATEGLAGKLIPPMDFMKITMMHVMVHDIRPYGSAYGHFEEVFLSFAEFKRDYIPTAMGGAVGGIASVSYNIGLA